MKFVAIAALIVGVGSLATQPCRAQAQSHAFELTRQLQDAQDGDALGKKMSPEKRDELRTKIVDAMQGARGWTDRRDRNAVGLFLLTGGQLHDVETLVSKWPKSAPEGAVVESVWAYVKDGPREGGKRIENVDPRGVSPMIAGALALAQARAAMEVDRAQSSGKFLAARALAPGGLIEETSLRQELFALDKAANLQKVERIAHRYVGRFSHSTYMDNFVRRMETLVAEMWSGADEQRRRDILQMLEALPSTLRRDIGVRLARGSLLRGDGAGARKAIAVACQGARQEIEATCDLYGELASIFDPSTFGGGETPVQARMASMSDGDRLIAECAKVLRAHVMRAHRDDEGSASGTETESMRGIREKIDHAGRVILGDR